MEKISISLPPISTKTLSDGKFAAVIRDDVFLISPEVILLLRFPQRYYTIYLLLFC